MKKLLALLSLLVVTTSAPAQTTTAPAPAVEPTRVACVGDSITYGAGSDNPYPNQLQGMLGDKYKVGNYGISGQTLLKKGDAPYWGQKAYQDAKDSLPNVVILMLGSNDAKPQNWAHKDEFYADYTEMVKSFQNLASKPKIFVCLPPPAFKEGGYAITQGPLDQEYPIIKKIATELHTELIDMHAVLDGKGELVPDNIHPNAAGDKVMAQAVADAITGKVSTKP